MSNVHKEHWTEGRVFSSLRHVFPSPAHVRLAGVRNGTGYARSRTSTTDGLVLSVYPSRGLWIAGVEIKVSRSDWKKEMANASKAHEIQRFCHYWYVAAPKGVVPVAEVPDTWGLIECIANSASIVKPAPRQTPQVIDLLLVCSVLRNFAEANVPTCEMQATVDQKLADAKKDWERHRNYEFESLRENVKRFEEAAGISLGSSWQAGNIGKAVKAILDLKLNDPTELAAYYRRQAEMARDRIDQFIASLGSEGYVYEGEDDI